MDEQGEQRDAETMPGGLPLGILPDSPSQPRLLLIVVAPVLIAYLLSTTWSLPHHMDALTNVVTAWHLGNTGSPVVRGYDHLADQANYGNIGWFVESDRGVVSQYPPGTALLAAPLYAVDPTPLRPTEAAGNNVPTLPSTTFPLPSLVPAAIVATLSTALAVGFLGLVFRPLVGDRVAVMGAWVAALGTTAWSVAADGLWQHGPAMMWIALGMYFASHDRFASGGLAFGAAILTRPHTGIIAATTGIAQGIRHKRWAPVLQLGAAAALGLAALLAYNRFIFGAWTISGGYGGDFTDQFVNGDLGWFVRNVWGGLFDLRRGFLVWSPFLIVLLLGVPRAWKTSPSWVKGAAIGGALYLLIQYRANRFSGGDGHFSYRYPLEALTAAAPLLALSYSTWIATHPVANRLFITTATASITAHAIGAFST